MNNNKVWNVLLIGLAIAGFIWAMDEKTKRIEAENKLQQKEEDYLKLLAEYLETRKDLPKEIKEQLINLRTDYVGINDAVAIKLKTVVKLIETGEDEIAIEKLALIVENLLKERYVEASKATDKKQCPTFYNLLKKAQEWKWIPKHLFDMSLFLKDRRNEEAHDISTVFSENDKFIAFLSGIEIIYSLQGIKRTAA